MMSEMPEIDRSDETPELELDAPAATSPSALLAKAGSLTGALVQRGRERSPRLSEASIPSERLALPAMPPALAAVSLLAETVEPTPRVEAPPARSRWSDAAFAVACGVAFFATFLFVLRF